MNRRGSLPVVILVLSVLALCVLALFVFYTSDVKSEDEFDVVIDILQEAVAAEESVIFLNNAGREIDVAGVEDYGGDFIFQRTKTLKRGWIFRTEEEVVSVIYSFKKNLG